MGSRENKRKGSGTENIELETILPVKWFFYKRRRDMGLLEDVGARNVFHGVSAFVSYEGRNAVPLCAAENSIIHGKGNRARERRNK